MEPLPSTVIEITNVTKSYQTLKAVDNISLRISPGEVLGLLGPNGAGKTTLFRLITGSLYPDEGQIRSINGSWPVIGYKPERLLFPSEMRVRGYLSMVASLSNLKGSQASSAVQRGLAEVDLLDAANKKIKECSKGMRQRLSLAQALIGNPSLLLLDEPSNGLDPEGQADICHLIKQLHENGKTIVLASHQLAEVTQVCTQLAILNLGSLHYQSSMGEALAKRPHTTIQVNKDLTPLVPLLSSLHPQIEVVPEQYKVILNHDAIDLRPQVLGILLDSGLDITQVEQSHVTLAEIYAEAVN